VIPPIYYDRIWYLKIQEYFWEKEKQFAYRESCPEYSSAQVGP
jgi:hypothetical protein